MEITHLTPNHPHFPRCLLDIPQPPTELYVIGTRLSELMSKLRVAIVGSRKVTAYGQSVTKRLASELAEQGTVIVSGLAIGVDALAHTAALDVQGDTIAVLGGGLDDIYPRHNAALGRRIIEQGGVLISEYPAGTPSLKHHFVERNRLIAGLSEGVVVTEAGLKSGAHHTITFAIEQGKTAMAVPGSIYNPQSVGSNNIIRSGGAVVTATKDILYNLGLVNEHGALQTSLLSAVTEESTLLELIGQGTHDGNKLLSKSGLSIPLFNQTLTMLEITGRIRAIGGNQWTLI